MRAEEEEQIAAAQTRRHQEEKDTGKKMAWGEMQTKGEAGQRARSSKTERDIELKAVTCMVTRIAVSDTKPIRGPSHTLCRILSNLVTT